MYVAKEWLKEIFATLFFTRACPIIKVRCVKLMEQGKNMKKKYMGIRILISKLIIMSPAIIIAVVFVLLQKENLFYEMEMGIEDKLYEAPSYIPDNIKIIAIDEETLDKLGPYSSWDRSYFAKLIELLSKEDNKPAVIGIDFVFTGTKKTASDKALADACAGADNVILASKIDYGSQVTEYEGDYYLYEYVQGEAKAYDDLSNVAESGFTNAVLDKDGYVRSAYSVVESEGKKYQSFAYKIASYYSGKEIDSITKPVFKFRFTGKPGEFECISMERVLDGTVPASYFKNSIVLIGAYEEGLLDSYSVPNNHSQKMYGVEIQANIINALLNDMEVYVLPMWLQCAILALLIIAFYKLFIGKRIKTVLIGFVVTVALYYAFAIALFKIVAYEISLTYMPIAMVCTLMTCLVIRYIILQKKRAQEMQRTLFSMADSMAEAIEGRTPYNASHTKNVADRCVQMLEYINRLYKAGKSELHFSKNDTEQLYLAAMLHDIGKMDVPIEIMDKPSKLGASEEKLRDRLKIIRLKLENDNLKGKLSKEEADKNIAMIDAFADKLGLFNCGKPLSDEEKEMISQFSKLKYIEADGSEIPYLTEAELDNLNIKAGTLSDSERKIMQSHVVHTDKILSHVYFGEDFGRVREIASNHHELINGKGYPNGVSGDSLDAMTRILTIMDIFDSLIADDRPYKKAKPVKVAFEILDEEAEAGKVDKKLLAIAKEIWLKGEENCN